MLESSKDSIARAQLRQAKERITVNPRRSPRLTSEELALLLVRELPKDITVIKAIPRRKKGQNWLITYRFKGIRGYLAAKLYRTRSCTASGINKYAVYVCAL
ncbi:hypothetical protein A3K34_02195 [candidate division WWE3 bacterium RIFOXYC1_FULL_40_10]|uniref:Uncharacterized protein n=1 Tax=candidate division WWE3 bacterium RIFOXYA2_FULL_46_9 TaxID=1802636 RepID=A0A1F4W1Q2_UNCKA|nr:MAG: hypothetical protein A3K58_02195 [candidate division WWE3 bacterium RIFOXYB1_FULL_40_22]OGC61664.1 MAG: hypothetical protein A3K37_02195 [candidate division WWE3 bacterium RIFOXYA1_FULL_40_11]OGC63290.1 MAG: hypothetical protein A2264_02815 [candidate division WWE3 bacterium RIFOXYA2_FULL_46_9]OGC64421.1 MAG: hypothetical protein A2326_02650 [candidate division WWE3 bacterium RIFOXYB2_FULL_41_6]OGC66047.1 MAG: hypothetical protein A3K34_02195 [candidate division WWE3 bacterium RIFOXYC1_